MMVLSDGAVPEIAPWVGTTVGSAIISAASGDFWQILAGAVIVAVGLTPLGLRSMVVRRGQQEDDKLDARERLVGEAAARVLRDAADLESSPRADRVNTVSNRIPALLDDIARNMFEGSPGIRVVLYDISDDRSKLTIAMPPLGRSDEAREFDASEERGELAIDRLFDVDDHYFCPDTSLLPKEWGADGRSYKTFISLPIRSSNDAYGMLTIDSPFVGDLTLRDAEMMETLASAFAFYRAAEARGKHQPANVELEEGN
jgi:hypothetical protein